MSIQKKTTLIVIATLIVLMVSLSLITRFLLRRSYLILEAQSVSQNVARLQDALSSDIADLNSTALDYAPWDDSYAFVEGDYPEYVDDNLTIETFENLRVNWMLFIDCSEQLFSGKGFDLETSQEASPPPGLVDNLRENGLFSCGEGIKNGVAGVTLVDQMPVLVAAQPIIRSDRSGPAVGTLIIGRDLNTAEVQRLSEMTHLSTQFIPFLNLPQYPGIQPALSQISDQDPVAVQPLGEKIVAGYTLIYDLAGQPALVLQVDAPREIYQQGQLSLKYLILALLTACLVFGGVTLFQLDKTVLSRLTRLSRDVEQIGVTGDHSARLTVSGTDELANLSSEINGMLVSLEQSEQLQRHAERRNILRAIPDLLFVLDQQGNCSEFKADLGDSLYLTPEMVVGKNIRDSGFTDESLGELIRSIQAALATQEEQSLEIAYSAEETFYFDVRIVALNEDEVVAIARDITERKRAEEALRESEERYSLAVAGANDGIWDWDLRTNRVYFSSRWKNMLGYAEGEIGDQPEEWFDRVHAEDLEQLKMNIANHLEGITHHLENELRIFHKDGAYRWMLYRGLAVHHNGSKPARLAGSQTDITERKLIEKQLQHKALHDDLTNLPNRTLFMDRLSRVLERAKRHAEYKSAVLFLDIDRFKLINDSLGHAIGDLLLVAISRRLAAALRPGDTISRFGGDEFAILMEEVHQASDATRVADRIQKELAKPFDISGKKVFTSTSVGIALTTPDYRRAEDLLRDADIAMYRAKSKGPARHEIFDTQMHAQALNRLEMEAELRQAIKKNQLVLHYQPIISLKSGKIASVEALLRWQHPKRGLLLPGEFLELAEETELIIPIGEWVLRTACAQARAWHKAGFTDFQVSVNISACQFRDHRLPILVQSILRETGLPPRCLEIEITEQTAMQDIDLTVNLLVELSNVSVQISLDDFGNGYSALGYLKRFPVNTLKIDRSFVTDVPDNTDDAAITTAIIAMAHVLNLKVIAEGVETDRQLDFLQSQNCDSIQGFLISRGLPVEEVTQLLLAKGIGPREQILVTPAPVNL